MRKLRFEASRGGQMYEASSLPELMAMLLDGRIKYSGHILYYSIAIGFRWYSCGQYDFFFYRKMVLHACLRQLHYKVVANAELSFHEAA